MAKTFLHVQLRPIHMAMLRERAGENLSGYVRRLLGDDDSSVGSVPDRCPHLLLAIPHDLHDGLSHMAIDRRSSLHDLIIDLLRSRLDQGDDSGNDDADWMSDYAEDQADCATPDDDNWTADIFD